MSKHHRQQTVGSHTINRIYITGKRGDSKLSRCKTITLLGEFMKLIE